ncbi:ABC transporter substrate-binding protein [Morganella morganii]|uniref:ABC transporter substrate-binding protein n=1 Tax=Morganella morganii TaxID=582 RepID=UPI003EB78B7B
MRIFLLMMTLLLSTGARAQQQIITDLQGRSVAVNTPVKRLFLADARDILAVDIAAGKTHFASLSGWSDTLTHYAPDLKAAYLDAAPELARLPVLPKSKDGTFTTENLLTLSPDAVLMHKSSYGLMKSSNLLPQLEAAGIPVIFIDFRSEMTENTPKSIQIIGALFETEGRAAEFSEYYRTKLAALRQRLPEQKPSVLIESSAGIFGNDCCRLYGRTGFGELADIAGGDNLVRDTIPANGAESSIENILHLNPQFYVLTGADWKQYNRRSEAVTLGYGAPAEPAHKEMIALMNRQGLSSLEAVKSGRVMAVYHNFYNSPLNIFAAEALAAFFHPQAFRDLNPQAEMMSFHQRFTAISGAGTFWVTMQ